MRLLVSIVDPAEVGEALKGGADIVDAKDVRSGRLAAPPPRVVRALRALVRLPDLTSIAIGDTSGPPDSMLASARRAAALGIDFVKVGLTAANAAGGDALRKIVDTVRATNPETAVVAMAYADLWSPSGPESLAALASEAGARGIMLDTARKDGRSLLDVLEEAELRRFMVAARGVGLTAALAGSLGPPHVERLRRLAPDVVGVRGAVCVGGRKGTVDARLVRALAQRIRSQPALPGTTTSQARPRGRAVAK